MQIQKKYKQTYVPVLLHDCRGWLLTRILCNGTLNYSILTVFMSIIINVIDTFILQK